MNGLDFVLFSDCAATQVAELILLLRMAVSWKSVVLSDVSQGLETALRPFDLM